MKKWMVFLLIICLMLGGCSSGGAVYVQSVEALSSMGGIAPGDHFLGLVVSEDEKSRHLHRRRHEMLRRQIRLQKEINPKQCNII